MSTPGISVEHLSKAYRLGIGNGTGIGRKQILGAVVGALIAAGGGWFLLSKPSKKK